MCQWSWEARYPWCTGGGSCFCSVGDGDNITLLYVKHHPPCLTPLDECIKIFLLEVAGRWVDLNLNLMHQTDASSSSSLCKMFGRLLGCYTVRRGSCLNDENTRLGLWLLLTRAKTACAIKSSTLLAHAVFARVNSSHRPNLVFSSFKQLPRLTTRLLWGCAKCSGMSP